MDRFVALYRGINVGGRNSVKMEALRAMHERLGHRGVTSYIQSGNVVFAAKGTAEAVALKTAARFVEEFGFAAHVIIVSAVAWGAEGSRVRGVCYTFLHEKMFGFLRFLKEIRPGLWNMDTRRKDSPYGSAFVHGSELRGFELNLLPSRDYIFEFSIVASDKGLQARDIVLVLSPAAARRAEMHPPSTNYMDQGSPAGARGPAPWNAESGAVA